jgi:hypothetical protein
MVTSLGDASAERGGDGPHNPCPKCLSRKVAPQRGIGRGLCYGPAKQSGLEVSRRLERCWRVERTVSEESGAE